MQWQTLVAGIGRSRRRPPHGRAPAPPIRRFAAGGARPFAPPFLRGPCPAGCECL